MKNLPSGARAMVVGAEMPGATRTWLKPVGKDWALMRFDSARNNIAVTPNCLIRIEIFNTACKFRSDYWSDYEFICTKI